MSLSRSRTIHLVVFGVLVFLSLKPGTVLEDWIERALLPARALAILTRPFELGARSEVRAAENTLETGVHELAARSRALLAREQDFALPRSPALAAGRGFVHAQVVERLARTPDLVTIQFDARAPLAAGQPVTSGDAYVGRVDLLSVERTGEARVRLVTDKSFRVGAVVVDEAGARVQLVVGGVTPNPREDPHGVYLAVHAPSSRDIASGDVRVADSGEIVGEPSSILANGFRLGRLVRYELDGETLLGVRAALDFDAGPYELVALTTPETAEAGPPLARDPFAAERWIAARAVALGRPSVSREGARLESGVRAGIESGAAVCAGGLLVGRVQKTSWWSASVRWVGDPGFTVQALAEIEGEAAPQALGKLVSMGRADDGALLFRWESAGDPGDPASRAEAVRATLFTGWGERNVPAGLLLGSTELVRSRGTHVVRVVPSVDARSLLHVFVWRPVLTRSADETRAADEPSSTDEEG